MQEKRKDNIHARSRFSVDDETGKNSPISLIILMDRTVVSLTANLRLKSQ